MAVRRPCVNCPWRRDVEPGEFPASRYDALRATAPDPETGEHPTLGAPMFACHKSPAGEEFVCAGWLAVVGRDHVTVRMLVATGALDAAALDPGAGWPELFESYEEMATAMGGPE